MKIFVVSKKTLIAGAAALLAVIAVIIIAVVCSKPKPQRDPQSDTLKPMQSGEKVDPQSISDPSEQYELEVLAGLMKEVPVYSVSIPDKKIALTIDAAWGDDKTEFIIKTLDKYNIKATFFLCGTWVRQYPDMVKLIHEHGHEIGNHSLTHPHMSKLSASQIQDELKALDNMLEPLTGARTKLFRAPFGEYNDNVIKTVRSAGYEVIQWNIDTVDWKECRSAQTILDTVIPRLKPGCVILCHNNASKIDKYLSVLIETALSQGYEFVTVSDLLLSGNTVIDVNGVQKPVS